MHLCHPYIYTSSLLLDFVSQSPTEYCRAKIVSEAIERVLFEIFLYMFRAKGLRNANQESLLWHAILRLYLVLGSLLYAILGLRKFLHYAEHIYTIEKY